MLLSGCNLQTSVKYYKQKRNCRWKHGSCPVAFIMNRLSSIWCTVLLYMSDVSWCTCTLFKRQALFVYVARVAISLQWCRRNDMQRLLFCTGHRLFHVSFRSYQACWTMAGKSGAFGTHSFHDSFRNHRDFFSLSLSRFTLSHVFKSVSVFTSRQPHRMGGCCCFHLPMVQKWKGSSLSPPGWTIC